ncbi:HlyD family efflux transporter periplasmic adaptor subunit [Acaryochloris sp. IP29b_bin.137]|uniref:HlyD family efflux transporter periplasmic adaptor subunit n=1 Tax=Acaryochloris sp. IP29b_bin.137 TaxID=2969217 RepID=UPI0026040632|nr:HlyD family efflux transporter periplasmic adaptor subunit [Acaryochloris sp. IP29b_bin.137]
MLICSACTYISEAGTDTPPQPDPPLDKRLANDYVVALGRLAPKGEVIKLSVPNAEDSRVNRILVQEGDYVEPGQVIAILQGYERKKRDLEEAQKTVEFFQARLAQLEAGEAKTFELAAQQSTIDVLRAQLRNEINERQAAVQRAVAALSQAEVTHDRNTALVSQGAISQHTLDESKETLDVARAMLAEKQAQLTNSQQTLTQQITRAQNNLATMQEVRPVDLRVAKIELERAQISVAQRRTDVSDTQVRVPVRGQILRLNTRVGERVNTKEGIAEIGQTGEMYAIAEIYETDILKIKVGQTATMTSEYGGFSGPLRGKVTHIGLQVGSQSLADGSNNPKTDENQRVVQVHIQIHPQDSPKITGLTNMQVRVDIDTRAQFSGTR